MPGSQRLYKHEVAGLLEELGYPVKREWSVKKLRSELARRREFLRACNQAFVGSVWEIIVFTESFWGGFRDFHSMCLLAQVSRVFARSVPLNRLAWEKISSTLPLMSNTILTEIYKIPSYIISQNQPMNQYGYISGLPARQALQIAYETHGGPLGFFRKREAVRLDREKKAVPRRFVWPRELMFQRMMPFLLEFVRVKMQSAPCLCTLVTPHREILRFLDQCAKKFLNMTISSALVYHFLQRVNKVTALVHANIVSSRWCARALEWTIKPIQFLQAHYPYTNQRLLREIVPPHLNREPAVCSFTQKDACSNHSSR